MASEPKNKRLLEALARHGEQMSRRADWLMRMVERQQQVIINGQEANDGFTEQLQATNIALDSLRKEYKELVAQEEDPQ